jgi:hypothetical protein
VAASSFTQRGKSDEQAGTGGCSCRENRRNQLITDYCWRLAEADLQTVIAYLKSRQSILKNVDELAEMVLSVDVSTRRLAAEFKREVVRAAPEEPAVPG